MSETGSKKAPTEGDDDIKEHNDRMTAALAITMLATTAQVSTSCATKQDKKPQKPKKKKATGSKPRKKKEKSTESSNRLSSLDEIFTEAISGGDNSTTEPSQVKISTNKSEMTRSSKEIAVEVKNRRLPPKKRKVIDMEIETGKLKDKVMVVPMKWNLVSSSKDIPTSVDSFEVGENEGNSEKTVDGQGQNSQQYPSSSSQSEKSGFQPVDPCRNMQILNDCQKALTPDDDGDLSIHIAVVQGEIDVVRRLIDLMKAFNKSLDTYNKLRQTALHLSLLTENVSIIQSLLDHGADPNITDRRGRNCLHMSVEKDRLDILDLIMLKTKHKIDLDAKTYEGLTPLHTAVEFRNITAAERLFRYGSDVNAEDSKSGRTCIHYAVEANNLEMAKLLINCKADLNVCSYAGVYPYQIAATRGYTDIKYLLQASGANVNAKVDVAYPPKKGKRRHSASMEMSSAPMTPLKIPIPRLCSQNAMSQPSTPNNVSMNSPVPLDLPPPLIYVKPTDSVPVTEYSAGDQRKSSATNTQTPATNHETSCTEKNKLPEKPKLRHSRSLDCDIVARPLSPVTPPGGTSSLSDSLRPRLSKTPPGRLRVRLSKEEVKDLQESGVNLTKLIHALQKGNFNEARSLMLSASKTASKTKSATTTCTTVSYNNLIPSVIPSMMDTDEIVSPAESSTCASSHQRNEQSSPEGNAKQIEKQNKMDDRDTVPQRSSTISLKKEQMDCGEAIVSSKSNFPSALLSQLRSGTSGNSNEQEKARPIMTSMLKEDVNEKQREKSILQIPQVPQHQMVQQNNPFVGQLPYMSAAAVPMMMPNNYSVAYAPVLIPHGMPPNFYPYHNVRQHSIQGHSFPATVSGQLHQLQNSVAINSMAAMTPFQNANKVNKCNNIEKMNKSEAQMVSIKKEQLSPDSETALDFSLPKTQSEKDYKAFLNSVRSKNLNASSKKDPKLNSSQCLTATEQLKSLYTSVSGSKDSAMSIENLRQPTKILQQPNELKHHSSKSPEVAELPPSDISEQSENSGSVVNDIGGTDAANSRQLNINWKKLQTMNHTKETDVNSYICNDKKERMTNTETNTYDRKTTDCEEKSMSLSENRLSDRMYPSSCAESTNFQLTSKDKTNWLRHVQNELMQAKMKLTKQPIFTQDENSTSHPFPVETSIDSDSLMIHDEENRKATIRRKDPSSVNLIKSYPRKSLNCNSDPSSVKSANDVKSANENITNVADERKNSSICISDESGLKDLTSNMENLQCVSTNIELPVPYSSSNSTDRAPLLAVKCEPAEETD